MKTSVKVVVILFFVYAGVVAGFESLIGYFQPKDQSTMVIATQEGAVRHRRPAALRVIDDVMTLAPQRRSSTARH